MALARETIVAAALRLLDEAGLDGVTLRKLAAELGVRAPALYWHFASKQELLDAMAAAMTARHLSRPELAEPGEWRAWLAGHARADRAMLNAYRDGARLVAGTRPSPEVLAAVERTVATLERVGFTVGDAFRGLSVLGGYVAGFVLEEQADRARRGGDEALPDMEAFAAAHPRVMAALRQSGDPQGEQAFEDGLQLVLDGLELRLRSYATREAGARQVSQAEGETAR
ncbi:TetR/AcrR family transcriptional regulator C-terminal domain-containing protein [Nonomuraea sp. NPDC050783]|uniref:TetR/AcrR family transcriptional regulator C-terminal domain-containing protein n=1 Tax=Nonomuraea sp. NPDC050783 TaxID=3154634 RepID=UPI0034674C2C